MENGSGHKPRRNIALAAQYLNFPGRDVATRVFSPSEERFWGMRRKLPQVHSSRVRNMVRGVCAPCFSRFAETHKATVVRHESHTITGNGWASASAFLLSGCGQETDFMLVARMCGEAAGRQHASCFSECAAAWNHGKTADERTRIQAPRNRQELDSGEMECKLE